MANKYNSEGYLSPTEYAAFSKLEKVEKKHHCRTRSGYRPLVYICSPYASGCVNDNLKNARRYSRFAVDRYCIPLTPHLLFPQFMDDGIPAERSLAMFMNMILLDRCKELWVFGERITKGMKQEISRARYNGMKIRWFTDDLHEKLFSGIEEEHT